MADDRDPRAAGRQREGPFTIIGGIAGGGALIVAILGALLPTARLVLGGALIGLATGIGVGWLMSGRPSHQHGLRRRLPGLLVLIGTVSGVFLLAAPAFMVLPGSNSASSGVSTSPTPGSPQSPTPSSAGVSGGSTPSPSATESASPPASPLLNAAGPGIRFHGQVRIDRNVHSALDSQPPSSEPYPYDIVVSGDGSSIERYSSPTQLAIWARPGSPSLQDCRNLVATQSQDKILAQSGIQFCVQARQGSIGYAKVLSTSGAQTFAVQLDVTIWDRT